MAYEDKFIAPGNFAEGRKDGSIKGERFSPLKRLVGIIKKPKGGK